MRSQSPPLVSAGHWALASIGIGLAFLWDDTSQCTEIGISYKSVSGELQLFYARHVQLPVHNSAMDFVSYYTSRS
jgi:hypothetical protein